MDDQDTSGCLSEADRLIREAEQLAEQFVAGGRPGEYSAVMSKADVIIDKLEEAQQLLLEVDLGDVTEAQEPVAEGEAPEQESAAAEDPLAALPNVTDEAFGVMVDKQKLEHRSREIEARVYRKAADLVGNPIVKPGTANEQQDELLNHAAVALEAAFASYPNPEVLISLATLYIEQLEIKKARTILAGVMRMEDADLAQAKAEELLARLDSDPSLKDRSRCFIATAACGDENAPEVVRLRDFRDRVLMQTSAGRRAVRLYYTSSPPLALLIERHPLLRRAALQLVVRPLCRLTVRFAPGRA